ncbi:MAG: glycosyltransferase [Burkholderiales bacterium]|nr:glycosyltransferase [Burkholderiales bacterium]
MARRIFISSVIALCALLAFQVWLALPSTEAVRLRNAFLIDSGAPADFGWDPAKPPRDFRWESNPPPRAFAQRAEAIVGSETRAFEGGLLIARDLLRNARDRGPIMADLESTYRRITEEGYGYCADFTEVFMALAHAAGIPSRQWAFSFDGFGGDGHAFVEVFDRARGGWKMIDVYNNFYPVTANGAPMSALEFRDILLANGPVRMQRISPGRLGFPIEAKAIDYYKRGARQWYLWWGNDVFAYERQPLVAAAAVLGRHAEQVAALATGSFPHFRVVDVAGNTAAVERMHRLRTILLANLVAGVLLVLVATASAIAWIRQARRAGGGGSGSTGEDVSGSAASALRVAIAGPLPPPSGGMANQCAQLAAFLRADGIAAEVVRNNAPYRPAWVEPLRVVRAAFRLIPYCLSLWRAAGRCDLVHVFANSGWAWHLLAAPPVWLSRLRGRPVVVNYRGGDAAAFLDRSARWVLPTLRAASLLVVPSPFLRDVFARHGVDAEIVPNIIDLAKFSPRPQSSAPGLCVLLARNLEPIYGIDTALRAFAIVHTQLPGATMVIAGTGPDHARLADLARTLRLADAVAFVGRIDNAAMPDYYRRADVALNSSTVDNMPISLLEAYASGVPVVSTDVGGVPFIARDGETALLVRPGDPEAMAGALLRLAGDRALYARLRANALEYVTRFAWPSVRRQWLDCYSRVCAMPVRAAA